MMEDIKELKSKESPELTEYPGMEEDYSLTEEDLEWNENLK